jgi:gluconate 2-dehydrogenase gamma chain
MIISTIMRAFRIVTLFLVRNTRVKQFNDKYRSGIKKIELPDRKTKPVAVNRRIFILRAAGFLFTLSFSPVLVRAAKELPTVQLKDPWLTLASVQDQLFPSEKDSPGAKEINAVLYLRNIISNPTIDQEEKEFILNGVKWLNDLSLEQHELLFTQLSDTERSKMLHQIMKTKAGRKWISKLLTYIFEALLGDPVYGGNPDGIGWKWLNHHPGFPRPPKHKRYWDLK